MPQYSSKTDSQVVSRNSDASLMHMHHEDIPRRADGRVAGVVKYPAFKPSLITAMKLLRQGGIAVVCTRRDKPEIAE